MLLPVRGKTERRLALVILLTALLPLASAMMLAYSLLNSVSSLWLRPEVEQELSRGIDLYKDYVRVVKDDMKHQTDAIAAEANMADIMCGVPRGHRLAASGASNDPCSGISAMVCIVGPLLRHPACGQPMAGHPKRDEVRTNCHRAPASCSSTIAAPTRCVSREEPAGGLPVRMLQGSAYC